MSRAVLVIGAGVQGLTTGIVLAEAGWPVRIRTALRPHETTSNAAGALWAPSSLGDTGPIARWAGRTHRELVALAARADAGVRLVPGTMAAPVELADDLPPEAHLVGDLRRCAESELPEGFVSGFRGTTPLVDMPRYLDHLVQRFRAAGGELVLGAVTSLDDAAAESDRVVNCAGVGARELVGDPEVHPVRGQSVVVRNPGVEEFFIELGGAPFAVYLPHGDRVVLGGVAEWDDWRAEPSAADTAEIVRRCAAVEPKFAEAEILEERVGFRPARPAVRLEAEEHRDARLVHNYGHASVGVTLSWGCAEEAAELVAGG
jgi:D-amino-acid oxidase